MVEEAIDVLIDKKIIDPQQPIYKGSRQVTVDALGDEVPVSWPGDTRAFRMPDIRGFSLGERRPVSVNVHYRSRMAYEMDAMTGIMNADPSGAFALFIHGQKP